MQINQSLVNSLKLRRCHKRFLLALIPFVRDRWVMTPDELHKATVGDIAVMTGVNRITSGRMLQALVDANVLQCEADGNKRFFLFKNEFVL